MLVYPKGSEHRKVPEPEPKNALGIRYQILDRYNPVEGTWGTDNEGLFEQVIADPEMVAIWDQVKDAGCRLRGRDYMYWSDLHERGLPVTSCKLYIEHGKVTFDNRTIQITLVIDDKPASPESTLSPIFVPQ